MSQITMIYPAHVMIIDAALQPNSSEDTKRSQFSTRRQNDAQSRWQSGKQVLNKVADIAEDTVGGKVRDSVRDKVRDTGRLGDKLPRFNAAHAKERDTSP